MDYWNFPLAWSAWPNYISWIYTVICRTNNKDDMTYKEALRYCQSVYGYRLNMFMFMFLQQGKHSLSPFLLSANLPFKNSTKMPPHLTRSVIMSMIYRHHYHVSQSWLNTRPLASLFWEMHIIALLWAVSPQWDPVHLWGFMNFGKM